MSVLIKRTCLDRHYYEHDNELHIFILHQTFHFHCTLRKNFTGILVTVKFCCLQNRNCSASWTSFFKSRTVQKYKYQWHFWFRIKI